MPIRTKTLLIFLSLSLIPLFVTGVLAYQHGRQTLQHALGDSLQIIASESIDKIDRSLYEVYYNVRTWSSLEMMDEVLTDDVDGKISVFLIGVNKQYGYFSNLLAINSSGEVVASSAPELIGNYHDKESFFQTVLSGTPKVSNVITDSHTGIRTIAFGFPIYAHFESKKIIGALVANWNIEEIVNMISPDTASGYDRLDTRILITQDNGKVIGMQKVTSDDLFWSQVVSTGMPAVWNNKHKVFGYLNVAIDGGNNALIGYDYSKGYRDFPGFDWIAFAIQDIRVAYAPIERLKWMILAVAFWVAFFVALISLLVTRKMTQPILEIADIADKVSQGNFEESVNHSARDEVGALAAAFNKMIHNLKEQRTQLVEKAYVENIIGSMTETLIVIDSEAIIRTVNDAGCRLLHYERNELIGRPISSIFSYISPFESYKGERLFNNGKITNLETSYLTKEGKPVPILFSSSLMDTQAGLHERIVCIAHDITERKVAEEKINQQVEELARSNAELEKFAYVASHDLQEPLRMVASYTQLLARRYKDRLDKDANEFIDYAVDGVERMQALINDLLQYSRVSTQKTKLTPINCSDIVDQVCRMLQKSIEENDAKITRNKLPTINGNATQLNQLFQNLITNAIKFRDKTNPSVRIEATQQNNEWLFSVRDNGIGIEPQYHNRVFELFQRLHVQSEYKGTGLGLAICKKIVELHGGKIWIEPNNGHGTVFNFTIPVIPSNGDASVS